MNPKDIVGAKKAPLTLVPPSVVIAAAEAMAVGAAKYGPYNWRDQPVQVMTYVEAVFRHLYAFIDGQNLAEDTSVSHLSHAVAGLAILIDAMSIKGGFVDNRPPKGPAADLLRAQDKSVTHVSSNPVPGLVGLAKFMAGPDMSPPVTGEAIMAAFEPAMSHVKEEYRRLQERLQTVQFGGDGSPETEEWGKGDGIVYDANLRNEAKVENRGLWPPDTRVAGYLTCCGQSEHPLDCPQYRS